MGIIELKWCCKCGQTNAELTTYIQMTDMQRRSTDWNTQKNSRLLCKGCLAEALAAYETLMQYDKHPLYGI
jgi:predicted nucleic-acid-binding Zn-ribbon protein